ncbi:MAG: hypothetical protein AB7S26_39690 [Sandaracinaceae bacterium]
MLEGLDEVAWDDLGHAYGSAGDVPDTLRRLAEGDDAALSELFGNIWHQGTVYEATAYAVPFLIEILDAKDAPLSGVLGLLAVIANGSSYHAVHDGFLGPSKAHLAEMRAPIARELGYARASMSLAPPHLTFDDHGREG